MIKEVSKESKYLGPRFNVIRKNYVRSIDNLEYVRDIVETKDAVVVLAINEDNEVYLVKQMREVIGEETLELPAGLIEENEDIEKAGIRELEEETAMLASNMEHLITVYSSCGFTTEKIHIYLATGLTKTKQNLDEDENITEVVKMNIDECLKLINTNYFKQANMNLAFLMYKNKYNK